MSKSLGNFITIRQVLNDWPGEVVRLNMLKTHYRQPIDWTLRGLEESGRMLERWYATAGDATPAGDLPESVLAPLVPAQVSNVNPFAQRLDLLVESRLAGNRWYVFADPATMPVLEYAYMSSAQGPQMASREGWDVLGMEFRVVLDFGCGVLDHRGAYLNAGA